MDVQEIDAMSGDRTERLKAGLAEALAIILAAALLVVLLTGSG